MTWQFTRNVNNSAFLRKSESAEIPVFCDVKGKFSSFPPLHPLPSLVHISVCKVCYHECVNSYGACTHWRSDADARERVWTHVCFPDLHMYEIPCWHCKFRSWGSPSQPNPDLEESTSFYLHNLLVLCPKETPFLEQNWVTASSEIGAGVLNKQNIKSQKEMRGLGSARPTLWQNPRSSLWQCPGSIEVKLQETSCPFG